MLLCTYIKVKQPRCGPLTLRVPFAGLLLTLKKMVYLFSVGLTLYTSVSLDEGALVLSDRKLSTYVNALAKAGFVIEQMIEESDAEIMQTKDDNNDFAKKAKMLPVTIVIKARKL